MTEPQFEDTGEIIRALQFSAGKHRNQRRKDQELSPYINHPIQLLWTLWEAGVRDTTVLVAAVLHDTIEDTGTSPVEIARNFGEQVLGVVLEVTDDKSLPKEQRKQLQIEHSPHVSQRAKLVKLADKISNLGDLLNSPPKEWSLERKQQYVLWSEKVVAGLRGTNPHLETRFDELLRNGKQLLGIEP